MRKEIQILLTALMFYTRIPVPDWIDHSEEYLNKATRYFPLIGLLVGSLAGMILYGFSFFLPITIALLLSMVFTLLLTGAFHEDGFADFCDAFGGGWTKERILTIMKDSRIGVFGAAGLLLMLLLKFMALSYFPALMMAKTLVLGHTMSRSSVALFIFVSRYVRENEDSKAKPVGKKMKLPDLVIALLFGLLPMVLFSPDILWIFLPLALSLTWFRRYLHKWIGGYTGDCLGAIQQVNELLIYLTILMVYL